MNLETSIKDVITQKLEDGTVDRLVAEQLEKGVKNALDHLFSSYGDVTKILEEQIKSVMVPYLEKHDYSEYIVKLDAVLVDILKQTASPNQKLISNFQQLMLPETEKELQVTDLFTKWTEHVAKNVETDGLEIDYDDEPSYELVEVTMSVEIDEERDWSSFKYATLLFECEHDEKMNFAVRLSKWKKEQGWSINYDKSPDIRSLRYLSDFEVLLMRLDQGGTQLILDSEYENEHVRPETEPEITFS
ncbi:hypothetical protein [Bacillus thuringiensis]|uniref:hypothetical protein n=1 Tax=Bacillus thuringiensis TaxID=1428 RepID=UPI000BF883AC|nr:hypothetical protein [Bacillus thuringiensis]PES56075.1 hypothetical protein CN499_06520 [Bacillus thuringiensis]